MIDLEQARAAARRILECDDCSPMKWGDLQIEALIVARALLSLTADDGWCFDMEKAKDGDEYLLWYAHPGFDPANHRRVIGRWDKRVNGWDIGSHVIDHAVAFRPLPPPPSKKDQP